LGKQHDKAIARLKAAPCDYTYDEARSLLISLGYKEDNKGSTSGSRVMFHKEKSKIMLHKPHPGNIMKQYMVRHLLTFLKERGELQ